MTDLQTETPAGADPDVSGRGRRAGGRRQSRQRRQRRRRRWRQVGAGVGVVLLAAVASGTATLLLTRPPPPPPAPQAEPTPRLAAPAEQATLLLVREPAGQAAAEGVILLAGDGPESRPIVLFLPTGTMVDLPGFGSERLGLAYQYGGPALVEAGVENALGVAVDHVATVSESGLAAFLGRSGGVTLALEERLVERRDDGTAEVRFEPGEQFLDGERLAELWAYRGRDEDELAMFSRQQLILEHLFDEAGTDPETLEDLVAGGAPQLVTTADPEWLETLLTDLVAAQATGRLRFAFLPVEPFGGGEGGGTYRLQEAAVAGLVASALADSVPRGGSDEPVRVQVLNGVGTPGIGQAVDRQLEGGRFRIVLTENARSFDFDETRILVYDETDASLAAAQRMRDRLGVGTIQISRQPQSIVDVTIVVGADFDPDAAPELPEADEQER